MPRKATIITGNPKYIKDNPKAQALYKTLQDLLEARDYKVTIDPGAPNTVPSESDDLWIGHSRGADRLRFAPDTVQTIALGSSDEGAINHPEDTAMQEGAVPTDAHYNLTPEMLQKLERLIQKRAAYKEGPESTVTSDGQTYTVDQLLEATKDSPTSQQRVKDLAWILKHTEVDPKRVAAADYKHPIIYTTKDGTPIVLDGAHRLTKALQDEQETIPAKFFNTEEADDRPYRDRVEMFGVKDGKVLIGNYKGDSSYGTYGGGIDEGEDPAEAGGREYEEEGGLKIKNPRLLEVPPSIYEWKPPFKTDKARERSKKYRGTRTYYAVGDIEGEGQKGEGEDAESDLQNLRYMTVKGLLNKMRKKQKEIPESAQDKARGRIEAIRSILKMQKKAEEVIDFGKGPQKSLKSIDFGKHPLFDKLKAEIIAKRKSDAILAAEAKEALKETIKRTRIAFSPDYTAEKNE